MLQSPYVMGMIYCLVNFLKQTGTKSEGFAFDISKFKYPNLRYLGTENAAGGRLQKRAVQTGLDSELGHGNPRVPPWPMVQGSNLRTALRSFTVGRETDLFRGKVPRAVPHLDSGEQAAVPHGARPLAERRRLGRRRSIQERTHHTHEPPCG